jgi:hypothetical protein
MGALPNSCFKASLLPPLEDDDDKVELALLYPKLAQTEGYISLGPWFHVLYVSGANARLLLPHPTRRPLACKTLVTSTS